MSKYLVARSGKSKLTEVMEMYLKKTKRNIELNINDIEHIKTMCDKAIKDLEA